MREKKTTVLVSILIVILIVTLISGIIVYNLGYDKGRSVGYIHGLEDGIDRDWNIRDPAYDEAMDFINSDKTEENDYSNASHICHQAAVDLKNNAFLAGYRCAYVVIVFQDNRSHAIVSFNTTDKGNIFIEPRNDQLVNLTLGEKYQYLPRSENITEFALMW